MVRAARQLQHSDEIYFTCDLNDAVDRIEGGPDVLLASGVLICLPEPLAALSRPLKIQAQYVVFFRTELSSDFRTHIGVQVSLLSENGAGPLPEGFEDSFVRYPNTFIPMSDFEAAIEKHYDLVHRSVESWASWRIQGRDFNQYAYLGVLKSSRDASARG